MEKSKTLFKDSLVFVKSNFWRLLSLLIIFVAFQLFISSVMDLFDALDDSFQVFVIQAFLLLIFYGVFFWMINIIYTFIYQKLQNNDIKLSSLFVFDKRKIWNLYVVAILSGLITLAGFILFIIPGIILSILTSFALLLVILKNSKPLDAIIHSFNMIWGRTWTFIGKALYPIFYFLWLLLFLAIGIIISISVSLISKLLSMALFVILFLILILAFIVLVMAFYVYYVKIYNEFEKTAPALEEVRYNILKKRFKILAFFGLLVPIAFAMIFTIFLIT